MTDKILQFSGVSYAPLPPAKILVEAKKADLDEVLVVGVDKEGLFYFGSSNSNCGDLMWLLKNCEKYLMDNAH